MDPKPGHDLASPRLERHHFQECRSLLAFTRADGRTTGFPLSWLYRFDYRKDEGDEQFTLLLTEHRVTITGLGLGALEDQLKKGEGFHVMELPERYTGIQRNEKAHVTSIAIEAVTKPNPESN